MAFTFPAAIDGTLEFNARENADAERPSQNGKAELSTGN
jgi:hypothetical protein